MNEWIITLVSGFIGLCGGIILERFKSKEQSRREFLEICSKVNAARGIYGNAFNSLANEQIKVDARKEIRILSGELQVAVDGLPARERNPKYYKAVTHIRALANQVGQSDRYEHYERIWEVIKTCLS